MVRIQEAVTRKDLKKFILFPFTLYKNDTNWVPPLIMDEWSTFDRKKNPSLTKAFQQAKGRLFLLHDGRLCQTVVAA